MKRRAFLTQAAALAAAPVFAGSRALAADTIAMFDAHIHLVSTDKTRYPQVAQSNPAQGGAPRPGTTGPGAPPGASVQAGRARPTPTVEAVLGWMAQQNVAAIAAVQRRGTYGYNNSYILDSTDAHPAQMAPVVVLDATATGTPAQLRGLVAKHGLAGVRLTGGQASDGTYPWVGSEQAQKVWQVAADTGIAIDLMYTPPGHSDAALNAIVALAEKFPHTRLVLDHIGWPKVLGAPDFGIDTQYAAINNHPNIFYKFTTINLDMLEEGKIPADQFLARAVAVLGANKIMWGSDMGNSPGKYSEMVSRVHAAAGLLSASDRQQVLHDTGAGFFVRGGVKI